MKLSYENSKTALLFMRNLTQDRVLCYTNGMLETVPDNRNYKDSVFVDLFSTDEKAKERFLSLYKALHRTQLHDVTLLENIKLEQVMYMSRSSRYIRVSA
ncbi:MAG: hypothetical protein ACTTJ4_01185 [Treponema sp.]|uniref:hypothetical protein n=1 Tax=Treponema sp. TaxID=166 RepID=UPI003FA25B99